MTWNFATGGGQVGDGEDPEQIQNMNNSPHIPFPARDFAARGSLRLSAPSAAERTLLNALRPAVPLLGFLRDAPPRQVR
jgi:hypothetical protein